VSEESNKVDPDESVIVHKDRTQGTRRCVA